MMQVRSSPHIVRWALVAVAITVLGWFLWTAGAALFPFAIAMVLAYILLPLVNRLERLLPLALDSSIRRSLAILLVYITVVGSIGLGFAFLVPSLTRQVTSFLELLPSYVEDAQVSLEGWTIHYRATVPEAAQTWVDQQLAAGITGLQDVGRAVALNAVQMVSATVGTVIGLLVVPVWLFFVLRDQPRAMPSFYGIFPPDMRATVRDIVFMVDYVLGRYIRAQLLLGVVVGVTTLIGLTILGIPFAPVLAVIVGLAELIPIVGPILGAVPAILVVLATEPSRTPVVILLYWGIQLLENNLLVPRIHGSAVQLPPPVIMILLVGAGEVAGVVGMLAAVPSAAILRDVFVYLFRRAGGHLSATPTETALEARTMATRETAMPSDGAPGPAIANILAEGRNAESDAIVRP